MTFDGCLNKLQLRNFFIRLVFLDDSPSNIKVLCNFSVTFAREAAKGLMRKSPDQNLAHSQDEQELSTLMKRVQQGDAVAYRRFLERLVMLIRTNVHNSLQRMGLSNTAAEEDVVQEVLLAVHSKRDTYDPDQFFLPWFYAIVHYKVIDFARSNRRKRAEVFEEEFMSESGRVDPMNSLDDSIDLRDQLEALPQKQREVLTLAKVEGLSLEEVSIKTGFSLSDVKVSVHRALQKLRKKLKEAHFEN
jgi:RNA polymerase sigma-70 factor, ECF subfamily